MTKNSDPDPYMILPTGTTIVVTSDVENSNGMILLPKGTVGMIVKSPIDHTHAYRVRFPSGLEHSLKRTEFVIQKHFRREGMQQNPADDYDLDEYIIYRCVVGSRAYGLDVEGSDKDLRGIYLPPAELHWSVYGVPEQLERPATEESYWEIQKFINLALKANPNILECLYTPLVEYATPLAEELREHREIFLSRLVYQTYNGYVMSQFKKMHKHLEKHGKIKWKHAMHLIRLLLCGITILEEGVVPVRVTEHREQLLAIRQEQLTWDEMDAWRVQLHTSFDQANKTSKLPDRPDYDAANALLIKARRIMVT